MFLRSWLLVLFILLAATPLMALPLHPAEEQAQAYLQAQDWQAAHDAFVVAAKAGSPSAMAWLGWMHEEGRGVESNPTLAVIWYTSAVEAGAEHLALKLAWLFLGGDTAIRNRDLAEHWFAYAIERGDLDAHVALSSVIIADALGGLAVQRVHQAREWLLTAHQGGHEVAKLFLARLYLEGIGGHPVDYEQAYYYAQLGAEQGHGQMQGWLALIYKEGLGRESDMLSAAQWALLAAATGDPLGLQLLHSLELQLSPAQLAEARQRAMAWAGQ